MALRISHNNNDFPIHAGQIRLVEAPFTKLPGFAIPLIQSGPTSNTMYVQRVSPARRIVGFDQFSGTGRVLAVSNIRYAELGAPEVYAIVDPLGYAHVGTKADLSPLIREWTTKIEHPLVRLNFARFSDDETTAEAAANEAVREKRREFKNEEHAIGWFIKAFAFRELLSLMAAPNRNKHDSFRYTAYNDTLITVIISDSSIRIRVPEAERRYLLSKSNHHKLQELLSLIDGATGRRIKIDEITSDKGNDSQEHRPVNVIGLQETLRTISRQEERFAWIVDALIRNPSVGFDFLDIYQDNSSWGIEALAYLRGRLNRTMTSDEIELRISAAIPTVVRRFYPLRRGRLLLALAERAGKFGRIADIVREQTLSSHSSEVMSVRDEILRFVAR